MLFVKMMLLFQCIQIFTLYHMAPPTYGDYIYPDWAIGMGWTINAMALVPLPVLAAYSIYCQKGSFQQVSSQSRTLQGARKDTSHIPPVGICIGFSRGRSLSEKHVPKPLSEILRFQVVVMSSGLYHK